MGHTKSEKETQDLNTLNTLEAFEIDYWADKFGISKQELARAVSKEGNNAQEIGTFLKNTASN